MLNYQRGKHHKRPGSQNWVPLWMMDDDFEGKTLEFFELEMGSDQPGNVGL